MPCNIAMRGFICYAFILKSKSCIIHSTPANFGAESSGAIIGIQMAGAYVGSTFAPPLFGLLGSALGFSILPAYLLVFAVFMIAMTELTFRTAEKNRSDTGP